MRVVPILSKTGVQSGVRSKKSPPWFPAGSAVRREHQNNRYRIESSSVRYTSSVPHKWCPVKTSRHPVLPPRDQDIDRRRHAIRCAG